MTKKDEHLEAYLKSDGRYYLYLILTTIGLALFVKNMIFGAESSLLIMNSVVLLVVSLVFRDCIRRRNGK